MQSRTCHSCSEDKCILKSVEVQKLQALHPLSVIELEETKEIHFYILSKVSTELKVSTPLPVIMSPHVTTCSVMLKYSHNLRPVHCDTRKLVADKIESGKLLFGL